MPTVLRIGSFLFHFYSDEGAEPPHIHVRCPDGECKFRLMTVALAHNRGVSPNDLREIEKLVFENRQTLIDKYSAANYDLYMTQAKLIFVIINHKLMIKHAIECIVLNGRKHIS